MYTVRFWNEANECIRIAGQFGHDFDNWQDAWNAANAFMKGAYELGAVEMDINNEFYEIIED